MIGVLTTFGTLAVPGPKFGFLVQSRFPTGVSTVSVFIASATFCLLFGSPLALRTAAATSNIDMLAPICWFHCLPVADSYPSPSCLLVMPVSEDLYGQAGAQ